MPKLLLILRPRIHGELLKLGIEVSQTTVVKYLVREGKPPSQTWRTFLEIHAKDIIATDFFTVSTATFRILFVLVILSHDRREILHTNVMALSDHAGIAAACITSIIDGRLRRSQCEIPQHDERTRQAIPGVLDGIA